MGYKVWGRKREKDGISNKEYQKPKPNEDVPLFMWKQQSVMKQGSGYCVRSSEFGVQC